MITIGTVLQLNLSTPFSFYRVLSFCIFFIDLSIYTLLYKFGLPISVLLQVREK